MCNCFCHSDCGTTNCYGVWWRWWWTWRFAHVWSHQPFMVTEYHNSCQYHDLCDRQPDTFQLQDHHRLRSIDSKCNHRNDHLELDGNMRKSFFLTVTIVMLLLVVATSGAVVTRNLPTVTVASQKLPNAVILTPGTTSYRQFSATCYSALVNMTALNNSTTIQSIAFQSFFIVIILPNQPVGNTTNTSFFSPNNLLTSIALFPPSPNPIPVTMQISFNNVCIPT